MTEPRAIDVQLLAIPESAGSSLYGMLDVLKTSGRIWREINGDERGPERLSPRIVATTRETFRCGYGIPVEPDLVIDASNVPEILVITDIFLSVEDAINDRHDDVKAWLNHCWTHGTTIYSACSGSVLVAAAGLLDGRLATSHWAYDHLFRTAFPKVRFDPTPSLSFSDEDGRLVTAGGASSWHDLALHIIARHVSPIEAISTAKFFLLRWHAEGQLPFTNRIRQRAHADSAVRRAEAWLTDNFCDPDPVAGVITAIGLPERTLKRRFVNATGSSLIAYTQNLRIEAAKEALENSGKPVEEIAVSVGYENVAFFRRLFKRCTGLSPSEYRRLYEPFWSQQSA